MSAVSGKKGSEGSKEKAKGSAKNIRLEEIWVASRMRQVNRAKVKDFAVSLREVGLKTPLSVRASSDPSKNRSQPWTLVAGAHRLEAAKELGWRTIRCEIFKGTEAEARIWEIRENLDRAELNALEDAEHVAALIQIEIEKEVLSQDETKSKTPGRPGGGVRAAARALGIDKMRASRSVAIAELPAKVKAKLRASELDDNQTTLLKVAKEPNEEAQLLKLSEFARRRVRKQADGKEAGGAATRDRRTEWQALVALAAQRFGKERSRFVRLAQEIGGPDLIRFAMAVRDWQPLEPQSQRHDGRRGGRSGGKNLPRFLD